MKHLVVKGISAILLVSIMLSVISCGYHSNKNARKISEDDPWFTSNIIEVDTGVEKDRAIGSWLYHNFIGMDDKFYIIETRGNYQTPPADEIDWETYDSSDYKFDYLAVVDRSTSLTVNTIDVKKDITSSELSVDNAYFRNGKITVNTKTKERDYDPLTGELLDTRSRTQSDDDAITDNYSFGDYKVETVVFQTETNHRYSKITVTSPDGMKFETELKKIDKDIYVYSVLAVSDTRIVILARVGKEMEYYELDLTTNELTTADAKDYEWLQTVSFYDCIKGSDGMLYYKDIERNGIFRINSIQKSEEKFLKYSWCSLNSSLINDLDLVECSEDHIVLCGFYDITSAYEGKTADKISLIELTKAEKNPHAGKTVLELYSRYGVNDYTGEAISLFNETNGKFFIEISERYGIGDYYDDSYDVHNNDVAKIANLNTGAGISNNLAIDIMNGEGPDILMDASSYSQLNNSAYLADLTPFLKDAGSDKYFTNIIEGSKTGDAIYQLPVSFCLEGIATTADNAGSSGKGFTLEEYARFTDEVMNGKDPIVYGQAVYFSLLFSCVSDEFIRNGKADLSKPEFEALAEYVKANVREEGISFNSWYDSVTQDGPQPNAQYEENCTGVGGFIMLGETISNHNNDITVLGLPSTDGRGPRFIPTCSVAISSQAVNVKACGEFVKILLSDGIQTKIAMNDSFVINREAFGTACDAAINYYNAGGSSINGGNSSTSLGLGRKLSTTDIELIESVILSCSRIKSEDSDIAIILIEEMPPYFLGQKNLDEVIYIAQDRIQKVLDERGLN